MAGRHVLYSLDQDGDEDVHVLSADVENKLAFFAVAEAFLAQHLGGSYEPIGDDFAGSSVTVPEGADQVTGVADALPKR